MYDAWNYELVGGNTVGTAVLFTGALALTFGVAKFIQVLFRGRLRKLAARSKTKLDDVILITFEKPIYWIALAGGISVSLNVLAMPDGLENLVGHLVTLVMITFVAWSLTNFIHVVRTTFIDPLIEKSESRLDDQIIPIGEKTLKVVIWSFAILIAFDNIGFDVVSLLTGLGIGGIALAMAARDTLANLFGSITIFTDRPFQVDDVVTLSGYTGTVMEIGLRTCRLKTFEGTMLTVPNAVLVGNVVENLSARQARRHKAVVGLVYETTAEQIEAAMQGLKGVLAKSEHVCDDYTVRFGGFGDSALEIVVTYWVDPPSDYFDVVSGINLRIKRTFEAAGWDMAFPSMTIYPAPKAATKPLARAV